MAAQLNDERMIAQGSAKREGGLRQSLEAAEWALSVRQAGDAASASIAAERAALAERTALLKAQLGSVIYPPSPAAPSPPPAGLSSALPPPLASAGTSPTNLGTARYLGGNGAASTAGTGTAAAAAAAAAAAGAAAAAAAAAAAGRPPS